MLSTNTRPEGRGALAGTLARLAPGDSQRAQDSKRPLGLTSYLTFWSLAVQAMSSTVIAG